MTLNVTFNIFNNSKLIEAVDTNFMIQADESLEILEEMITDLAVAYMENYLSENDLSMDDNDTSYHVENMMIVF